MQNAVELQQTLKSRVLPLSQKITARGTSRPDWMIATELAEQLGADIGVESIDDLTAIEVPVQALQMTVGGGKLCSGTQFVRSAPRYIAQDVRQCSEHSNESVTRSAQHWRRHLFESPRY